MAAEEGRRRLDTFDCKGVRVIVNLDNPLRGTTYYPGR
jgi:hypothetical protein